MRVGLLRWYATKPQPAGQLPKNQSDEPGVVLFATQSIY